jgi:cytochrome c biogenesis protein CcmG/thiol:disulfide interchange protein DsbE
MIRRRIAALVGVLLLVACGVGPADDPGPLPDDQVPSSSPSLDLAAQKKAAGIEDCPASDDAVPVVSSGLPSVILGCLGGGREVRLAGLRGEPMMINVWAQWCGPCREEAPYISEVAAANESELMILGIDYNDPRPELAIEFAQLSDWAFPQLVDQDTALRVPLQIIGPPQTFFVRSDGTIAYRHTGPFTSAEQIRSQARQYLGVDL